jgi:hypothetical protein
MKAYSRYLIAMLSVAASTAYASCEMNEQGYANISGAYTCAVFCPAGGVGNTAYVTQNGRVVQLINEAGQPSDGTVNLLAGTASDWNITFKIANNCKELIFSNSTIWLRK